jgi:hypothetical protein
MPIAYSALQKGTPVAASGTQFGVVEHLLEIPAEDLFDGIGVSTAEGLRFVDRDQIDNITTAQVRCVLTDERAQTLSPPDGGPRVPGERAAGLRLVVARPLRPDVRPCALVPQGLTAPDTQG